MGSEEKTNNGLQAVEEALRRAEKKMAPEMDKVIDILEPYASPIFDRVEGWLDKLLKRGEEKTP